MAAKEKRYSKGMLIGCLRRKHIEERVRMEVCTKPTV